MGPASPEIQDGEQDEHTEQQRGGPAEQHVVAAGNFVVGRRRRTVSHLRSPPGAWARRAKARRVEVSYERASGGARRRRASPAQVISDHDEIPSAVQSAKPSATVAAPTTYAASAPLALPRCSTAGALSAACGVPSTIAAATSCWTRAVEGVPA